jgi:competence protein ComEC
MTALMLFTTAWVAGIIISNITEVPFPWFLLAVPAAVVLLTGWGNERWARRGAAMLLALLLGANRLLLAQPEINKDHIAFYNDCGEINLEGVLDGELDRRTSQTIGRMKAEKLTFPSGETQTVHGHVLVTLPPFGHARYGDRIVIQGFLDTPPVYDSFSYKEQLSRQGIYSVFHAQSYTVVASHRANIVRDVILQLKTHLHQILLHLYAEPYASLLSGILLGIESGIPNPLKEAFNATGTGHIVAISGFNLSIVAGGIANLTRRLFKKRGRTWAAIAGVWIYVILVGASAAVLRAGVMSTLGVIAIHEQRKVHGPTALATAVFVLTLINPFTLWDLGFQLSFTATLGMVLYTRPLEKFLQTVLEQWLKPEHAAALVGWSSDSLLVTIAAQMVTVGVIVGTFQRLSVVSLLTNFMILPAQFYIMLFGGISLLSGLVLLPVAHIFAWLAWIFLAYTTYIVNLFARVPGASIALERVTLPVIWAYFTVLAAVTWLLRSKKDERIKIWAWIKALHPTVIVTGAALIVIAVIASVSVPDGKLHVVFMDVGAGEAVYIRTPHGKQILVDGGKDSPQTLTQIGQELPFWDRSLDVVILTSPDKDRLAGLVGVLERYEVKTIITGIETASGPYYDEWLRLLSEREQNQPTAVTLVAKAGDHWTVDEDISLDVLWPPATEQGPLVLQLKYSSTGVLLPGNATTLVEEVLVDQYRDNLRSAVLLVPRYGAGTSATPAFLQTVNPEIAVATGDRPVSPYVLARLGNIPLYTTTQNGRITLVSTGSVLKVHTTRD